MGTQEISNETNNFIAWPISQVHKSTEQQISDVTLILSQHVTSMSYTCIKFITWHL